MSAARIFEKDIELSIRLGSDDLKFLGITDHVNGRITVKCDTYNKYLVEGYTAIGFHHKGKGYHATCDHRYEGDNFALTSMSKIPQGEV